MDDFKKKMNENVERGTNKTPNECYWEVVGGWKKGKVQGLGDGGDVFYEKSSGSSSKSTGRTYNPSMLSQLSTQVEEARLIAESSQQRITQMESEREEFQHERMVFENSRVEFERQRAALEMERLQLERDRLQFVQEQERQRIKLQEDMLQMEKQMAEFSQVVRENCNSQFSPYPRHFDHDPSNGGAPCAT